MRGATLLSKVTLHMGLANLRSAFYLAQNKIWRYTKAKCDLRLYAEACNEFPASFISTTLRPSNTAAKLKLSAVVICLGIEPNLCLYVEASTTTLLVGVFV